MQCCLALLALSAPRLTIILVVVFSDYIGEAFQSVIWPFLGFVCLPLTTLAYAWAIHSRGSVAGFQLVVVVLAVLMDLGVLGSGAHSARRERPA